MKRRSTRVHIASVLFGLSPLALSAAGCITSTNTPPPTPDGGVVFPDGASPLIDANTPRPDSSATPDAVAGVAPFPVSPEQILNVTNAFVAIADTVRTGVVTQEV